MSLAEDLEAAPQAEDLRRALRNAQVALRREKDRSAGLVEATLQAARDATLSMGPVRPVRPPKLRRGPGDEQVALMVMGDWQGSKVTTSYDSEVMKERVALYTRKVERVVGMHRDSHPVRKGVFAFGGDMVEGLFNFPTQPFEIDQTLFGQFVTVGRLLTDVVRWGLSVFDEVEVVSEWGNHGRLGSRRSCVPRSDNLDRMCYAHAAGMLEGEGRLTWNECPTDVQRIRIGKYRALLIHGDEIGRNGFASPMTIVRHADRWASGSYPWKFRDVYSHHYHTHAEFPMANGRGAVYQTGSTESDNRYTGEMLAAAATPSQRLHFVDPREGMVTAQYKILLDKD